MRMIYTVLFLFATLLVHAQTRERVVSGRLTDSSGEPIPGVNIVIKGTTVGTTTDINGNYSITAPIGSTLVFSFIGMTSREVIVSEENSAATDKKSQKKTEKVVPATSVFSSDLLVNYDSLKAKKGVAVLTDDTPAFVKEDDYNNNYVHGMPNGSHQVIYLYPNYVGKIRFVKKGIAQRRYGTLGKNGVYVISPYHYNAPVKFRPVISFSTFAGIQEVNRLPSLQNIYAQGQPVDGNLSWRGGELQEIFSWGPRIQSLEFDGSSYPFDKNGRLVSRGTGNGRAANIYDPYSFFSKGSLVSYDLSVMIPLKGDTDLILSADRKEEKGIIPLSGSGSSKFSGRIKGLSLSRNLRSDLMFSYASSSADLMNRGGNLSTIVGSVMRTPPTFDNANGYTSRQALKNIEAYLLPDHSQRTHAAEVSDNPYWLVNMLPDHEKLDQVISYVNLKYTPRGKFTFALSGNYDRQTNSVITGVPPLSSAYVDGRLTDRHEESVRVHTNFAPTYRTEIGETDIESTISYQFSSNERILARVDAFGFTPGNFGSVDAADQSTSIMQRSRRNAHEVVADINVEYRNWLIIRLLNRTYFSNTLSPNDYSNFLPTAGFRVNIHELTYYGTEPFDRLSVYANYSRSMQEAPLIYSNWSYNSTRGDVADYSSYFESSEIFFSEGLLPERHKKFESGVNADVFYNRVKLEYSAFYTRTDNFIAPVFQNGVFVLSNAAQVRNSGHELSVSYLNRWGRRIRWGADVKWSQVRPVVKEVYSGEIIPLAGFNSAATVLAEGKPVGAIYGTTFQRNEENQLIIGPEGFPLSDPELKMIGNPNPGWLLGFTGHLTWKYLKFSFLIDSRYGGDMWNGTQQVLNYLGRSAETGGDRQLTGYIFDGITPEGNSNTTIVSFADPALSVTENRWTRYGWEGVGEEAIQDGSWIRLNEIKLTVDLTPFVRRDIKIQKVELSLLGKNLFLSTPYSGVDPAAALFGYNLGAGLDLFNVPSTRSYGAQLTIKI